MAGTKGAVILVVGDVIAFIFSLVLTLVIRYGEIPSRSLLLSHAPAFSVLIVVFIIVNFCAGLYEKQSSLTRDRLNGLPIRVQIVNAVIGISFFYFAPVTIAPKANLFIYFVVSTALILIWRTIMYPVVAVTRRLSAILVGGGDDVEDLHDEINHTATYGIVFKEYIVPQEPERRIAELIGAAVKRSHATVIVADLHDRMVEASMPYLYSLIFSGIQVIDADKMYERIFDRVPVAMVGERWLVENSGTALGNRRIYDSVKRAMDIAISGVLGLMSLVVYPFVFLAIKIDDGGDVFVRQERIGKDGRVVTIAKFRSMSGNDHGKYGNNGSTDHVVTRVGRFIRATRIDELPQLFNVLVGNLSLIGPRPELPALAKIYDKEIPYYNARHLVKPGLSGWAQIYHQAHPHHAVATEDTRDKLSYDLYYIKNRSMALDLKIALRTIQILLKRAGK
ncbi:MAG: hypothetical protein QOG91_253 [Candidatus Parcubacteria bacterium]|nr:hypothetical protein [Candidatus Parcubacteria bacterium]